MSSMSPKAKVALMASMLGTAVAGNASAAGVVKAPVTAIRPTTSLSATLFLKFQQLKTFLTAPASN
jgi:hypothetical protein